MLLSSEDFSAFICNDPNVCVCVDIHVLSCKYSQEYKDCQRMQLMLKDWKVNWID